MYSKHVKLPLNKIRCFQLSTYVVCSLDVSLKAEMMVMKLVVWQTVLTEHQVHLMRALHESLAGNLIIVRGVRQLNMRQDQGWLEPDCTDLAIIDLTPSNWWSHGNSIILAHLDAIHLFNGFWGDRRFFPLLYQAQRQGCSTALMTEPYAEGAVSYFNAKRSVVDKIKAVLRPLCYRVASRLTRRRMCAVFAISVLAVRQFSSAGFPVRKIYPFGYFVPGAPKIEVVSHGAVLKIIFVGSLIARKGVDTLLAAIQHMGDSDPAASLSLLLQVDIYGPGDPGLFEPLPDGVNIKGPIPFGSTQKVIQEYDVLILPSLHDGWGVVVNEALLQSVPVITSDAVGARSLIECSGAGAVFPVQDSLRLAEILTVLVDHPEILLEWRARASRFSDCLTPVNASRYLLDCLAHAKNNEEKKPCAPWYVTPGY